MKMDCTPPKNEVPPPPLDVFDTFPKMSFYTIVSVLPLSPTMTQLVLLTISKAAMKIKKDNKYLNILTDCFIQPDLNMKTLDTLRRIH